VSEDSDESTTEQAKEERLPKRKDKYKCPKCGNTLVVHVKLSEPPYCQNPKEHTSTVVAMELVK
jgi:rubrerythrin